jgi:hypothetical protein
MTHADPRPSIAAEIFLVVVEAVAAILFFVAIAIWWVLT